MSAAVVPFAQQGTVDWVALSNASAHFTVGVLARLSKAGVDPFTLQMGRAICANFTLTASVQQSLTDAIQKLKKFGSYGNVIWFGFGIKQIVTDLSETEEGLACVSLCAALSTVYGNMYSAQVLRDICRFLKAPESFTPALQQWRTLVILNSGILMSHRFSLHLNTFRTLIIKQLRIPTMSNQEATPSASLARALLTLAHVSNGKLLSATFTGGLDCAWLAAYAEMILSLQIEIICSTGMPLYRSRSDIMVMPQIRFLICNTTASEQPLKDLALSKTCLIESGRTLFNFTLGDSRVLRWRAPWASILHETFDEAVDQLLNGFIGRKFIMFLHCTSNFPDLEGPYYRRGDFDDQAWQSLRHAAFSRRWEDDRIRGQKFFQKFLQLAVQKLPELASCTQGEFSDSLLPDGPDAMEREAIQALVEIKNACPCKAARDDESHVCLSALAHTIQVYSWILLSSTIEEDVQPSVPGLMFLYNCQKDQVCENSVPHQFAQQENRELEGLGLVLKVFAGTPVIDSNLDGSLGAASNDGICVYHNVIENPEESPDSIAKIRIARGYISYGGTLFTGIEHRENQDELDPSFDSSNILQSLSSDMNLETVVEDTDQERILKLGFRVTYSDQNTRHTRCLWLDFSYISHERYQSFPNLRRPLLDCSRNCQALYQTQLMGRTHGFSGTGAAHNIAFDPASADTAQELLHRIRNNFGRWILMVREDQGVRLFRFYMTDRYLMLHLIMSNVPWHSYKGARGPNIALCPLNRCLTCLVGVLWWDCFAGKFEGEEEQMSGSIEMINVDHGTMTDVVFKLVWNAVEEKRLDQKTTTSKNEKEKNEEGENIESTASEKENKKNEESENIE